MAVSEVTVNSLCWPLAYLFWKRVSGDYWKTLQARCPSCHPTISVKAVIGTQTNNPSDWPDFIDFSFTIELLVEGSLLTLCHLSEFISTFT